MATTLYNGQPSAWIASSVSDVFDVSIDLGDEGLPTIVTYTSKDGKLIAAGSTISTSGVFSTSGGLIIDTASGDTDNIVSDISSIENTINSHVYLKVVPTIVERDGKVTLSVESNGDITGYDVNTGLGSCDDPVINSKNNRFNANNELVLESFYTDGTQTVATFERTAIELIGLTLDVDTTEAIYSATVSYVDGVPTAIFSDEELINYIEYLTSRATLAFTFEGECTEYLGQYLIDLTYSEEDDAYTTDEVIIATENEVLKKLASEITKLR